jgi:hypothetical protein
MPLYLAPSFGRGHTRSRVTGGHFEQPKSIILHHKSQCFKHFGVLMANKSPQKQLFSRLQIKIRPKDLHKSLTPDPWPLPPVLSTTVESALQIHPFFCKTNPISNKANERKFLFYKELRTKNNEL